MSPSCDAAAEKAHAILPMICIHPYQASSAIRSQQGTAQAALPLPTQPFPASATGAWVSMGPLRNLAQKQPWPVPLAILTHGGQESLCG